MTTMYSNLIFSIGRAHRHFDMPWEFLVLEMQLFLMEMKDLQR